MGSIYDANFGMFAFSPYVNIADSDGITECTTILTFGDLMLCPLFIPMEVKDTIFHVRLHVFSLVPDRLGFCAIPLILAFHPT